MLESSSPDWRVRLKVWREHIGMTWPELARRSGLAQATLKAYANGSRQPSREALEAVISALGIPREEAEEIIQNAGYATDPEAIFGSRAEALSLQDLAREGDGCPWPTYVSNQSFDVLYANRALQAIFDVDLDYEYQGFGERNLLGGITHEEFACRVGNWDELVTFMIGLAKGDPRWGTDAMMTPPPWLERPIKRFFEGNPARIQRFSELWGSAPPLRHRVRHRYRIRWVYRPGTILNFRGLLSLADLRTELHWNEWVPLDVETWQSLSEIVANNTTARTKLPGSGIDPPGGTAAPADATG